MADDTFDSAGEELPSLETPVLAQSRPVATPGISAKPAPSFSETLGAQFDYNNLVGSLASSKALREGMFGQTRTPITDDELNKRISDDGLADYVNRFLDVQTKEQYDALRSDIYRELEDKRILSEASFGMSLLTGAIATTLDLPTLIPVGKAVQLGRYAGEAFSLMRTAGEVAAAGALDAGIREAGLHAVQQTRTLDESLENVGASILFSVAVGVPIAKATNVVTAKRVGDALKRDVDNIGSGKTADDGLKLLNQIEQGIAAERGAAPGAVDSPVTFKTAKGSTYEVQSDGTTIRNKALRDDVGHEGDQGIKPASERTVYLTEEAANEIGSLFQATHPEGTKVKLDFTNDGRIGVRYTSGKDAGKFEKRTVFEFSDEPSVGATPLELWKEGTKAHFGNKIVEVGSAPKTQTRGVSKPNAAVSARIDELNARMQAEMENAAAWVSIARKQQVDLDKIPRMQELMGEIAAGTDKFSQSPTRKFLDALTGNDNSATNALRQQRLAKNVDNANANAANTRRVMGEIVERVHAIRKELEALKQIADSPETQTGGGSGGNKQPPPPSGGGQKALPPPEPPKALTNPHDSEVSTTLRDKIGRTGDWVATGQNMTAEQSQVANDLGVSKAMKKVNDWLGGNIVLDMRQSRFKVARDFIANLTPSPTMLKGNFEGINTPQSARALTARMQGIKDTSTRELIDAYKQFRKGFDLRGKDLARFSRLVTMALANDDKAPSWMTMNDRADIAGAYERTADLPEGSHSRELSSSERAAIERAAKAARRYSTEVANYNVRAGLMRAFDASKKYNVEQTGKIVENEQGKKVAVADKEQGGDLGEARDLSKLGKYVDPSNFIDPDSYIKHIFTNRILHDEHEFIRLEARAWIENWERTNNRPFGALRMRDKRTLYNRAAKHASGSFRAIVHGFDSEGQIAGGSLRNMGNRRGSVIDRNVMLSSKDLLRRGWIEDDILHIMDVSFRQNVTDAALAMRFRRPPTIKEINAALRNDADAYWLDGDDPSTVPDLAMTEPKRLLMEEGEAARMAAKSDDERSAIQLELDAQQKNIDDAVNILRGRYEPQLQFTAGARRLAMLRDFVFVTRLNNFLTSSLPDVGTVLLEHGPGRVARFMAKRAVTNFKELASLNLSERSVHRLRRDARAAGVAGEHENLGRIAAMVDISDPYSGYAAASTTMRGLKNLTSVAAKVQGIPYWNSWLQRVSYGIFQDRVIEAALHPNKLNKDDITWLAHHGINDREFLDAVKTNYLEQNPKYSSIDGLYAADHTTWDIPTQERFLAAARDSARNAVITPEPLEKPRFMHRPGGASMLQFLAYTITSTGRVTAGATTRIANGTNADMARVGLSLGTMMAAATLGIYLRAYATGELDNLPDWDDHKGWWMYEVLDRSGITGMFSNINNVIESTQKIPGARRVLQSAMGDSDRRIGTTARSIPRTVAEALSGPSATTINDLGNIVGDPLTSLMKQFDDQIPYDKGINSRTVKSAIKSTPILGAAAFQMLGVTGAVEQFLDEDVLGVPYDGK